MKHKKRWCKNPKSQRSAAITACCLSLVLVLAARSLLRARSVLLDHGLPAPSSLLKDRDHEQSRFNESSLDVIPFARPTGAGRAIMDVARTNTSKVTSTGVPHVNIKPHYRRGEAEERAGAGAIVEPKTTTLALVDPYLIGGFRNQHMRFVALVNRAMSANLTAMLLPSLRWSNAGGTMARSSEAVPHELLFDVEYWNAHREVEVPAVVGAGAGGGAGGGGAGIGARLLPSLVPFDAAQHGACWDNTTGLFRNVNASLLRHPTFRPRRHDLMKQVDGCTGPYGYGSGYGAGRLWEDYISMQNGRPGPGLERDPIEIGVFRALRPSRKLQRVVDSFISHRRRRPSMGEDDKRGGRVRVMPPEGSISADLLLAVHPRVEVDMLGHRCARHMVKNLTALVGMMESSELLNDPASSGSMMPLHGTIFLAISRSGMVVDPNAVPVPLRGLANENFFALNRIASRGLWNGSVPVLESGEGSVRGIVPRHASNVAGSVVDFFISVDADAFLGTYGSSFSVDVWTVRYYMGRGDKNYVHSSDGIERIPNGGLPRPHGYCR